MLDPKTVEINGKTYTIGMLPAAIAFDIGCIVAEWRGKQVELVGADAAAFVAGLADTPIERLAFGGRYMQITAKMLRDPEYRTKVWDVVLGQCSCDGVPVLRGDWQTTYAGARLGDLLTLHTMAIDHSCAGFLLALGASAPPAPKE